MLNRTTIIAEAGVNHNGLRDMALRLVDAAADAGADVVKFQLFRAEALAAVSAPKADYQKKTTGTGQSQLDMLRRLELGDADFREILGQCRARGIRFMATPFDELSLEDLIGKYAVEAVKLGSGEVTNGPLLLRAAHSGKPVILSTGMSTLTEVEAALGVLAFGYSAGQAAPSLDAFRHAFCSDAGQEVLRRHVTLLHCTTEYPTPYEDVNLKAMDTLRETFRLPTGLSDHTPGIHVAVAAVARGAVVIEKHLTLDRASPGPDHRASLEPHAFRQMVTDIRQIEVALGNGAKVPAPAELGNLPVARRSLLAARDIRRGETFTPENVAVKRPGTGVSPMHYWEWLGKTAERDYKKDQPL